MTNEGAHVPFTARSGKSPLLIGDLTDVGTKGLDCAFVKICELHCHIFALPDGYPLTNRAITAELQPKCSLRVRNLFGGGPLRQLITKSVK